MRIMKKQNIYEIIQKISFVVLIALILIFMFDYALIVQNLNFAYGLQILALIGIFYGQYNK